MKKFAEFLNSNTKVSIGGYCLLAVCAFGIALSFLNGNTGLLVLSGIGWLTLLVLFLDRVE